MSACPICQKAAAPRAENAAFPFCSARCKQIDLAKWLTGEYRIPTNELADEPSNDSANPAAGNRKETSS